MAVRWTGWMAGVRVQVPPVSQLRQQKHFGCVRKGFQLWLYWHLMLWICLHGHKFSTFNSCWLSRKKKKIYLMPIYTKPSYCIVNSVSAITLSMWWRICSTYLIILNNEIMKLRRSVQKLLYHGAVHQKANAYNKKKHFSPFVFPTWKWPQLLEIILLRREVLYLLVCLTTDVQKCKDFYQE